MFRPQTEKTFFTFREAQEGQAGFRRGERTSSSNSLSHRSHLYS